MKTIIHWYEVTVVKTRRQFSRSAVTRLFPSSGDQRFECPAGGRQYVRVQQLDLRARRADRYA